MIQKEPGSAEDIKAYAATFGVEFDMFSKVDVNGPTTVPLYKYLKSKLRGSFGDYIKWNYTKVYHEPPSISDP